jgi:hypothetical protein
VDIYTLEGRTLRVVGVLDFIEQTSGILIRQILEELGRVNEAIQMMDSGPHHQEGTSDSIKQE